MIWSMFLLILLQVIWRVFCANRSALRELDTKICHNEPTCHLLDPSILPANRFVFPNRDCMCDENCKKYRDCCVDSRYYKLNEQNTVSDFYCYPSKNVYMKINCSKSWADIAIDVLCTASLAPLKSDNTSLIQPVTSLSTNVTYGNKYCAICNGENETDIQFWTLEPACGEIETDSVSRVSRAIVQDDRHQLHLGRSQSNVEVGSKFINALIRYLKRRRRRKRDIINSNLSVDFHKYWHQAANIWKSAKYNSTSKLFVARYDDKNFICRISTKLPKELRPRIRPCVSNIIEKCDDTGKWHDSTTQYCVNHTSIIYDKRNKRVYRNKYCAECNSVEFKYLTGCMIVPRAENILG